MITLGVSDLGRAREFYENLGWVPSVASTDDVVFFQAGGLVLGLWGRDDLAADSGLVDSGGWGGVTPAYNVRSPGEVHEIVERARRAGRRWRESLPRPYGVGIRVSSSTFKGTHGRWPTIEAGS